MTILSDLPAAQRGWKPRPHGLCALRALCELRVPKSVDPANLGGVFAWNDSCCGVEFGGWVFSFVENSACTCLGCRASGAYVYEGYSIPVYGGWCCRLSDEPKWRGDCTNEATGVSASFSSDAVLFERSYQNTPGVWHPGKSTKAKTKSIFAAAAVAATLAGATAARHMRFSRECTAVCACAVRTNQPPPNEAGAYHDVGMTMRN